MTYEEMAEDLGCEFIGFDPRPLTSEVHRITAAFNQALEAYSPKKEE